MKEYRHQVFSARHRAKPLSDSEKPKIVKRNNSSNNNLILPVFQNINQDLPFNVELSFKTNQPFQDVPKINFLILDKSVSAIKSDLLPIFTRRHASLGNCSTTHLLCGKLLARQAENNLTNFTKEEMMVETNIRIHTNTKISKKGTGNRIDRNFSESNSTFAGEPLFLCSGCLLQEKIFLVLMVSDSPSYKRHTCIHQNSIRRKSLDRITEENDNNDSQSTTDFEQTTWTKTTVSKNSSKKSVTVAASSDSLFKNNNDNKVDADMPLKLAIKPSKFEKVDSQYKKFKK